jgi:hypothetical protein
VQKTLQLHVSDWNENKNKNKNKGGDILVSVIVQIFIRRINLQLGAGTFLSSNKQNPENIAPKKKVA